MHQHVVLACCDIVSAARRRSWCRSQRTASFSALSGLRGKHERSKEWRIRFVVLNVRGDPANL